MAPTPAQEDLAQLKNFLQCRCGTLTEAFARLDLHSVGQVTSDDFAKGLEKLGYKDTQDPVALFQALDQTRSGLVSLTDFFKGLGASVADDADVLDFSVGRSLSHRSLGSRNSEADGSVWATARRFSSEGDLHRPRRKAHSERPPAIVLSTPTGNQALLHSVGSLDTSALASSVASSLSSPVGARLARLEEQLEADRRTQDDAERRLISVVGASIAEQLDALRQTIAEEQAQRQVDVTGIQAVVEELRAEFRSRVVAPVEEARNGESEATDTDVTYPVLLGAPRGADKAASQEKPAEPSPGWELEAAALRGQIEALQSQADAQASASLEQVLATLRLEFETALEQEQERAFKSITRIVGEQLSRRSPRPGADGVAAPDVGDRRLAALEAKVANMEAADPTARLEEVSCEVTTLEAKVVGMEAAAADPAAKIAEVSCEVSALEAKVVGLEAADHDAKIAEVRSIMGNLEDKIAGLTTLEEKVGSLEAADLTTKLKEVRRDIDFTHERIEDEVENAFRKLSADTPQQPVAPSASEERLTTMIRKVEGLLTSFSEQHDLYGTLRSDVDILATQVGGLLQGGDGVRECLAALRGDVETLGSKLQEDVCANAEHVRQRVQQVEDSLQRSLHSVPAGGDLSGSRTEAWSATVEALCTDRLVEMDLGIARIAEELANQARIVERLQQQSQRTRVSEDMQDKLQHLLAKVDDKCVKTFGVGAELLEAETPAGPMATAIAALEYAQGCMEQGPHWEQDCVTRRSSAPGMMQAPAAPGALDVTVPFSDDCKESKDSNTIEVLIHENLRLREDNVAMREAAVSGQEQDLVHGNRSISPRRRSSPRRSMSAMLPPGPPVASTTAVITSPAQVSRTITMPPQQVTVRGSTTARPPRFQPPASPGMATRTSTTTVVTPQLPGRATTTTTVATPAAGGSASPAAGLWTRTASGATLPGAPSPGPAAMGVTRSVSSPKPYALPSGGRMR